ncbi:unnamed protein product [Blepharisma stoltei]|uniref:Uncharacterized protein n=1 Tax=Blepharisma stoltei TaxID=1481888 RepID=A0AAU9J9Y5_9CILI|nr:unnamed protein product [Blepharisma stoltei]
MGIFEGLIVHRPLTNQRRYDFVINEIYQHLLVHQDEIQINIETNKYIHIQALYGSDITTFPLSCFNMRTNFFRIYSGLTPPEDVMHYGSIVWECLNILRENYPSHIEISEENLGRCAPHFTDISDAEILRRQISCISSRKDDPIMLHSEEMEDLWYVLYSAVKAYDIKGIMICLEILNSNTNCPPLVFKAAKTEDLRLLEGMLDENEVNINALQFPGLMERCREMSRNILKKIILKHPEKAQDIPSLKELGHLESPRPVTIIDGKYEMPCTLNALVFQLTETACIERATFLLESLNGTQNLEDLVQLRWPERLKVLLEKYCDGIFGEEEHDVIKYGLFQDALATAVIKLSKNPEFLLLLLNTGFFERFFEVLEEACVLAYNVIIHKDDPEECKLYKFIDRSLKLSELTISPGFYKFLRPIQETLVKVSSKLMNLTHHGIEDKGMPAPDDPEELKLISLELYEFKQKLSLIITKTDALLEYQERHEDKYARLFPNL